MIETLYHKCFPSQESFCNGITRQSVLFVAVGGKPLLAKFHQVHASSDVGAVLPQACHRQLGLIEALLGGISDPRQSGKVWHATEALVRQQL